MIPSSHKMTLPSADTLPLIVELLFALVRVTVCPLTTKLQLRSPLEPSHPDCVSVSTSTTDGCELGASDCIELGCELGAVDGCELGALDGAELGCELGAPETDGCELGLVVGA